MSWALTNTAITDEQLQEFYDEQIEELDKKVVSAEKSLKENVEQGEKLCFKNKKARVDFPTDKHEWHKQLRQEKKDSFLAIIQQLCNVEWQHDFVVSLVDTYGLWEFRDEMEFSLFEQLVREAIQACPRNWRVEFVHQPLGYCFCHDRNDTCKMKNGCIRLKRDKPPPPPPSDDEEEEEEEEE